MVVLLGNETPVLLRERTVEVVVSMVVVELSGRVVGAGGTTNVEFGKNVLRNVLTKLMVVPVSPGLWLV